jgi:hypothetical protein
VPGAGGCWTFSIMGVRGQARQPHACRCIWPHRRAIRLVNRNSSACLGDKIEERASPPSPMRELEWGGSIAGRSCVALAFIALFLVRLPLLQRARSLFNAALCLLKSDALALGGAGHECHWGGRSGRASQLSPAPSLHAHVRCSAFPLHASQIGFCLATRP